MIILTLRTDNPQAEIGLYDDQKQLAYMNWQADRQLADTIHDKIQEILNKSSISLEGINGLVVFKGPGSFTGLRIGVTVANTLAYSFKIPIVSRSGANWFEVGIKDLLGGQNDKTAIPEYGSPANTTFPRK
jgi:tRNA threonylcarbamoyladenosine biosynthesis protein TsaB